MGDDFSVMGSSVMGEEELSKAVRGLPTDTPRVRVLDIAACESGLAALGSDGRVYLFDPDYMTWLRLPAIEGAKDLEEMTKQ